MCDYSLMILPNRLATDCEELVTHRFSTGSMGLASSTDVEREASAPRPTFWSTVKDMFGPPPAQKIPAVCIPPGSRLFMHEIPHKLQRRFDIPSDVEVKFEQLSAEAHTYRDAIQFPNGRTVRLQELPPGQHLTVLNLGERELEFPGRQNLNWSRRG